MNPTMDELRAEADEYASMSADRRRTYRQKQSFARGIHPATKMPLLEQPNMQSILTCGDCVHSVKRNRKWWKCDLVVETSGPGTDIRVSWVACVKFEAGPV